MTRGHWAVVGLLALACSVALATSLVFGDAEATQAILWFVAPTLLAAVAIARIHAWWWSIRDAGPPVMVPQNHLQAETLVWSMLRGDRPLALPPIVYLRAEDPRLEGRRVAGFVRREGVGYVFMGAHGVRPFSDSALPNELGHLYRQLVGMAPDPTYSDAWWDGWLEKARQALRERGL